MKALEFSAFTDLDWDLTKPCNDCPFRRSTPWHEGVAANAVKCAESIQGHKFAHTCHKTDARADSDQGKAWQGRPKHCAGSLIMLIKTGRGLDLQLPLLKAAEAGLVDIQALSRIAKEDKECFTLNEFMRFQGEGLGRLIRRKGRRNTGKKRRNRRSKS